MTTIGKYEALEEIGSGSMGTIWRARDTVLDRPVALKVLKKMGTDLDSTLRERFYREARSCARLRHSNIVQVYDLVEVEGAICIAMELLEGKDLRRLIREKPDIPLVQKLDWMAQVCDALDHAHSQGLVHRDVKPSNIFITGSEGAKVLDFGIARLPTSNLTLAGEVLGSPNYMAPEQIRGKAVDARSDIFSAAIVFCELLVYAHPFQDRFIPGRIVDTPPDRLRPKNPQIPDVLERLMHRALEKDPDARFQKAAELAAGLRAIAEQIRTGGDVQQLTTVTGNEDPAERRAEAFVLLVNEFETAMAKPDAAEAGRLLDSMKKLDQGDGRFGEAVADCESRFRKIPPPARPAAPAVPQPTPVTASPAVAAKSLKPWILVAAGIVLLAVIAIVVIPRKKAVVPNEPLAPVAHAELAVGSAALWPQAKAGGVPVATISKGQAVNILELPTSADQQFVRVQVQSTNAVTPPGYLRLGDLMNWQGLSVSAQLSLVRLFAEPATGTEAEVRSRIQRFAGVAQQYPGTPEAAEATVETVRLRLALAEKGRADRKPEKEWKADAAEAEQALSGLAPPASLQPQVDGLRQQVAQLTKVEGPSAEQILRGVRPLWEDGDYASAIALVNKALALSPGNPEALSWRKRILAAEEAESKAK